MGGWLGPEGVGGSSTAPDYKTQFFSPAPELEHPLEDGLDLLGGSSVEDFQREVKEGEVVLWLPGTPRRRLGCG